MASWQGRYLVCLLYLCVCLPSHHFPFLLLRVSYFPSCLLFGILVSRFIRWIGFNVNVIDNIFHPDCLSLFYPQQQTFLYPINNLSFLLSVILTFIFHYPFRFVPSDSPCLLLFHYSHLSSFFSVPLIIESVLRPNSFYLFFPSSWR